MGSRDAEDAPAASFVCLRPDEVSWAWLGGLTGRLGSMGPREGSLVTAARWLASLGSIATIFRLSAFDSSSS